MAKSKTKKERGSKSFEPKVKNRVKFARHARASINIGAHQIAGTNCYNTEVVCKTYGKYDEALKYAAIMISGSDAERTRATESLRKLQPLLK